MRNNTNSKRRNGKNFKGQDNASSHSREGLSSSPACSKDNFNDHGDSKAFNDPDWYINSEQILKDVARVPYSIPVGTCYVRNGKLTPDTETVPSSYDNAIPGIMVSFLMPTLGATSQNSSAGINIAANSLFQNMRAHISGSRKYEAVDVMLYMGAMDSIFTNITWFTRLYATAYTYHQSNKYLAEALVNAQNVDFNNLVNNLPQFRTALNIEIAKIRSMYLPSVLPIFKRHSWMFSHYFIEGDSEKDQIYCHAPAGYYTFDLDSSGKGMIKSHKYEDKLYSWTELIQILRNQIDAIFRREDFNTISGDMLKTYEGNVFTLTEIPDIATVTLTNSTEVLLQFKNGKYKNIPSEVNDDSAWLANFFDYIQNSSGDLIMLGCTTLWGTPAIQSYMILDTNDNVVETVDNNIRSRIVVSHAMMNEWTKDTLLTTPSHDVEPVENMINTRLTLGLQLEDDASALNQVRYDQAFFGSEWPVKYKLYAYHRNKSTGVITLFSRTYDRVLTMVEEFNALTSWVSSQEPVRSAFKYLPEISLLIASITGTTLNYISEAGRSVFEVDNYAFVSNPTLEGIHTAAILGEYDIPNLSIGK